MLETLLILAIKQEYEYRIKREMTIIAERTRNVIEYFLDIFINIILE